MLQQSTLHGAGVESLGVGGRGGLLEELLQRADALLGSGPLGLQARGLHLELGDPVEVALQVLLRGALGVEGDPPLGLFSIEPVDHDRLAVSSVQRAERGLQELPVLAQALELLRGGCALDEALEAAARAVEPALGSSLELAPCILSEGAVRGATQGALDPPGEGSAVLHGPRGALLGFRPGRLDGWLGLTRGAGRASGGLPHLARGEPRRASALLGLGDQDLQDAVVGAQERDVRMASQQFEDERAPLPAGRVAELEQSEAVAPDLLDPRELRAGELLGEAVERGRMGALVLVHAPLLQDEPRALRVGREADAEERGPLGVRNRRVQDEEHVPGGQGLHLAHAPATNELAELADELGQVRRSQCRPVAQESSSATL